MHILALVTDAFGGLGGIAQYNRDLLRACAEADSQIQLVVLPRIAGDEWGTLPGNLRQFPPQFNCWRYSWGALQTIRRQGPFDIVFCGHLFMAPLAALLARVFNTKLWLQLHGVEAWQRPSALVRWGAEQADMVTAVSRYTRRHFLAWADLPPERVRVLSNTVQKRFQPGPKPGHLLERYGLTDHKILLTVGRLSPSERYKGHDRVIAILPQLLKVYPNLKYIIAGDGDDLGRLEQLIRENRLEQVVLFIGRVDHEELPELYRLADVFVMPSTGEGFGIVFLEAAASGLQVVGGNQDGSVDALVDGQLGAAVDPEQPDELIGALLTALNRQRNNNDYVAHFGFDRFAEMVGRLIAVN